MIFLDTSGIYALADPNDGNHGRALRYFDEAARESFAITLPVMTESCWLLEARLGASPSQAFWEDVCRGAFHVHPLDATDLSRALEIDRRYAEAGLGFVDSTSLATCERLNLDTVLTFDRRDFAIYRRPGGGALTLVP